MNCAYCGGNANFNLKNGKWCCEINWTQCPELRKKNSTSIKKAHESGKMRYDQLESGHGWNKGKTGYSDLRIRSNTPGNSIFLKGSELPRLNAIAF